MMHTHLKFVHPNIKIRIMCVIGVKDTMMQIKSSWNFVLKIRQNTQNLFSNAKIARLKNNLDLIQQFIQPFAELSLNRYIKSNLYNTLSIIINYYYKLFSWISRCNGMNFAILQKLWCDYFAVDFLCRDTHSEFLRDFKS